MQIIEYFEDGQKEHWIKEIEGFSWGAAKYLAKLLRENSFEDTLGKNGKLFLLIDGEKIVSFVTLTHQDCIADESLFPWLGFVFTAPEYRGRRYSELLIEHACGEAAKAGSHTVYLATDHIGFYENTDLSIKKTARIQAGKTAGYIINSYSKQKTRSLRE